MSSFDINAIPRNKIAAVIAALAARLLAEPEEPAASNQAASVEPLLTARELADRLGVHESKVRSEQRAGGIPHVTIGRYIRFKASEVERALKVVS